MINTFIALRDDIVPLIVSTLDGNLVTTDSEAIINSVAPMALHSLEFRSIDYIVKIALDSLSVNSTSASRCSTWCSNKCNAPFGGTANVRGSDLEAILSANKKIASKVRLIVNCVGSVDGLDNIIVVSVASIDRVDDSGGTVVETLVPSESNRVNRSE